MKNTIIAVLVVVVAAGAWWYYYGASSALAPSTDTTTGDTVQGENSAMPAPGSRGATVTIKKGGTITFVNGGGGDMWVASAPHPAHTAYSGTSLQEHCSDAVDVSFDQCKIGDTYSFTFDKTGSFKYHNHTNSSQFGTVVVE